MNGPYGGGWSIHCETWAAGYGSPYTIDDDDLPDTAVTSMLEGDPSELGAHAPPTTPATGEPIAFVDGVRRGEAILFAAGSDGTIVSGMTGAFGIGAVVDTGQSLEFAHCATRRLAVWGSGQRFDLPPVPGGFTWDTIATADTAPDGPLRQLQITMRAAERRLATQLRDDGYLVVVDGPLNALRSLAAPVIGYVKTHHRVLLASHLHAAVPHLPAGCRTSLFSPRPDIYSCYHRLAEPDRWGSPWQGIVRLELPTTVGLDTAIDLADHAVRHLPRYAGVAHIDPRAPQNLQPVGALEHHLRHRLGDQELAARAARTAVVSLLATESTRK